METLDLRVKRPLKTHTESEWSKWGSEPKVINFMVNNSGKISKELAYEAGINPTTLSKASNSDDARLSERDLDALMDATGDEAWLHFWLIKRGYDPRSLRRFETDLERENRQLREHLEKLNHEREVELRLLTRIRVAA